MHDITITIQHTATFEYFNKDQNVDPFNLSSTIILEFYSVATITSIVWFYYPVLHQLSHPFHFSEPNVTDLTYLPSVSRLGSIVAQHPNHLQSLLFPRLFGLWVYWYKYLTSPKVFYKYTTTLPLEVFLDDF